jgi:DNA polymerase
MVKKGNKIEVTKVYGGLIVENCVQALARIVITDAMIKMRSEGMKLVLMTHDEIVTCCPESQAESVYNRMGEIMSERPDWSLNLPLASEGGWARNYSK